MSPLPEHRPPKLSLGFLEKEILTILWNLGTATGKQIHDQILSDPNRELSYPSVTTVLNRLSDKGWVACDQSQRAFVWRPLVSQQGAKLLQAHAQLNQFLAVSNPDIVAAFADSLDTASVEQLEAIAQRLRSLRQAREEE
ncbi:MAG: CopY family transcriptional regulator [Oscillatoriales cyanobacterium RM2_1_1]|nr:CopY family transcriptional regulator [Oscillatoriales cyanobacterium SM2_3_0]NJO47788.1 CopY family transcriptional regulator [Oscillatoriales cyanobacterium RM2_1_1]